jgi:hypothetical protein
MTEEMTQFIIAAGDEFYNELPGASTSDPNTDARDWIDSFVSATLNSLTFALHHHLSEIAQDWNAQAGSDIG